MFSKFFRNNPEKYVPRIAADIDNFVRNPIFRYTRASDWFIPVNRRNKRGDNSLQIASEVADKGWNQLWFPGGTRDWKNTATVISRHGKSMGMFKRGFAKVAHEKNLPIIPIWYERKGFIVYIVIGERLYFGDKEVEVIVHRVEQSILSLADTVP